MQVIRFPVFITSHRCILVPVLSFISLVLLIPLAPLVWFLSGVFLFFFLLVSLVLLVPALFFISLVLFVSLAPLLSFLSEVFLFFLFIPLVLLVSALSCISLST